MTRVTWSAEDSRRLLSRSLRGSGIELGPGERPFPLHYRGATARSLDRWSVEDNVRLFREVNADAFSEPDLRTDLNVDRLSAFADDSLDFIIASHVLEHLVEPLGQLQDMHRALAPGGILLLFLPDRRRTFDRTRQPTSLEHLAAEYRAKVTHLDDAHIEDFLSNTEENWAPPDHPSDKAELFDLHRKRSIHVHVWTDAEFVDVIAYCIEQLGMQWELVDLVGTDEIAGNIEFGFSLRKSTIPLAGAVGAEHFRSACNDLVLRSRSAAQALEEEREQHRQTRVAGDHELSLVRAELQGVAEQLAQSQRVIANHERFLAPLRRFGGEAVARWIRR